MNIWKVKIWLSQAQKEVSKLNQKNFLVLKVLYFRHEKQTSKNIADTTFKAFAFYFSFFLFFFTKWQPLNNYKKCFLFHEKTSFHCQDIQIFVFPSSPLFSRSAIGLECDVRYILKFMTSVSNCLNKNLMTDFVWYLEKEKRNNIELCQLREY